MKTGTTPDETQSAALAACAILNVPPEDFARAENKPHDPANRARYLALAGLIEARPRAKFRLIAEALGFQGRAALSARDRLENQIKTAKWWRDDWVEAVAAAVRGVQGDAEGSAAA